MTSSPPSSNNVWGSAERVLSIPVGRVHGELVRVLGQLKFTLTTDQLTVIEGHRGSSFAGASRTESKVPVQVKARLTAGDPGSSLWIEVRDGWKLPIARPIAVYQEIIADVLDGVDAALRRVDPSAAEFPPPTRSTHVGVAANGAAGRTTAKVTQVANRYLDNDQGEAPKGWRDTGNVAVMTPRGVATLPIETVYGMVTAGALVAARPGPMPAKLVSQVEQLVGRLEGLLQTAGSWAGNSWIQLEPAAVPVVEFLVQQARIRETVPLRSLQVCVTCRLAKVVNPDYARLKSRTSKIRTLQSSVGLFVSSQGVSPFVLIGKLAQLNQLDPEFVCPRCQGLHAENSLITFCPQCGDQRGEAALRECSKCQFDFRGLAKTTALWQAPAPVPTTQFPAVGQFPGQGQFPGTQFPNTQFPGTQFPIAPTFPATQLPTATPFPATADTIPAPYLQPAFYPDPSGRHHHRWWDGYRWAEFVLDNDQRSVDPLG